MCRFLLLRLSSFRVLFLLNDVLKWTAWFIKIDYTALRTRCYSFFFSSFLRWDRFGLVLVCLIVDAVVIKKCDGCG